MIVNKLGFLLGFFPPAHHTWKVLISSYPIHRSQLQKTPAHMKWLRKFQKTLLFIDFKESLPVPFKSTLVHSVKKELVPKTSQSQRSGWSSCCDPSRHIVVHDDKWTPTRAHPSKGDCWFVLVNVSKPQNYSDLGICCRAIKTSAKCSS